jgi:hypothetical protein
MLYDYTLQYTVDDLRNRREATKRAKQEKDEQWLNDYYHQKLTQRFLDDVITTIDNCWKYTNASLDVMREEYPADYNLAFEEAIKFLTRYGFVVRDQFPTPRMLTISIE